MHVDHTEDPSFSPIILSNIWQTASFPYIRKAQIAAKLCIGLLKQWVRSLQNNCERRTRLLLQLKGLGFLSRDEAYDHESDEPDYYSDFKAA